MKATQKSPYTPGRWFFAAVLGALAILFALYAAVMVRRVRTDPDLVLLLPEHGAQWIRLNEPPLLWLPPSGEMYAAFRSRFEVAEPPAEAILTVRALKRASVFLDGQLILAADTELDAWKRPRAVDLASRLEPGRHELFIHVSNVEGPCALLAYCEPLGLATGPDWEVTDDGQTWKAALPANAANPTTLSRKFPRADRALLAKLPVFVPIFLLVFGITFWLGRRESRPPWLTGDQVAVTLRWLLLLAWVLLAANNVGKAPGRLGFDTKGHLEYIQYVAEIHRIPLATEGWQMFQAPLYHIVSAPLYLLLAGRLPQDTLMQVLSVICLLCGIAQVEICYRALRHVYPSRPDLQCVGMVVGGLMPMNLYMSQGIGNEPLAACFSGIALVFALRYLREPEARRATRTLVLLGVFLGLALLSKLTALLLIPPVALLVAWVAFNEEEHAGRAAVRVLGALGAILIPVFVIAGWYYVRNWVFLGKPFVGGWVPERGIVWWQYPGFRTLRQFLPSAEALFHPLGAPTGGFPDAIYTTLWTDGTLSARVHYEVRPPWNYGYLLSGVWLGLLPTLAIVVGAARTLRRPILAARTGTLFALTCLGIFFAALVHLYLVLPIYSTAKATYTLSLLPCYAIIAATGLDLIGRRPFARAAVYAGLSCWALAAYAAHFVC